MGEARLSRTKGDELFALGLGSCIGLVIVDPGRCIAGLAHIVLPDSAGGDASAMPAKFADTGVPHLIEELVKIGGHRTGFRAALVGGAAMFALKANTNGGGLDIGVRNQEATKAALAKARVPIVGHAIGGNVGRTVRIDVHTAAITVKETGGQTFELWRDGARALASVR